MPKRVIAKCHYCGHYIHTGEQYKVTTSADGVRRYHFDHGLDCLAAEGHAIEVMHQMEAALEGD